MLPPEDLQYGAIEPDGFVVGDAIWDIVSVVGALVLWLILLPFRLIRKLRE